MLSPRAVFERPKTSFLKSPAKVNRIQGAKADGLKTAIIGVPPIPLHLSRAPFSMSSAPVPYINGPSFHVAGPYPPCRRPLCPMSPAAVPHVAGRCAPCHRPLCPMSPRSSSVQPVSIARAYLILYPGLSDIVSNTLLFLVPDL